MRGRKNKPLTIKEFNREWDKFRASYNQSQTGWHKHVLANFDELSEGAIRFIADDDRIFFGDWLRQAAVDRVFEWDILNGRRRGKIKT